MRHRFTAAPILALAVLLALAAPAFAGGWAVSTLDALPAEFRAGQTYPIGYTIRHHGQSPFLNAQTAIRATSASGEVHRFAARADDQPGHYTAEVSFPTAGAWTWEVDQSPFGPQSLGNVTVLPAAPAATVAPAAVTAQHPIVWLILTIAALAACGLLCLTVGHGVRRADASNGRPTMMAARTIE